MRMDRLEAVAAAGFTLLALAAVLPGVPAPVRVAIGVAFFLAVPGLAWVRLLPVRGPVEQAAVVVAVSLALDVLVAEALLAADLVSVPLTVLVLGGLTVVGFAWTRRATGRVEVVP